MKSQVTITLTKDLSNDQIKKMEELLNSPALLEATTQAYEKAVSQLFGGEQGVKTEVQIVLLRGMKRMNKEQAINIAVACVMGSQIDGEYKQEVIDILRELEDEE